tara:strand:- start:2131 stop:2676 length:546 start_codon:yes stop_codon:yes gene_type:complete
MIFYFITGLYAGMVSAHGNVPLDQDDCVRGIKGSKVHLSAYQLQNDSIENYCREVPKEGEIFFVVDLIDRALRNMPVTMRVVRGTDEINDETVSLLRTGHHPDGVIGGRVNLDKGQYTVFITGESIPPVNYQYPLNVEQINYMNLARIAIGILIISLLLFLFMNKFIKWKLLRNWFSSRHI